jgi:hypothetical protein
MFAAALAEAERFTFPVLCARRFASGDIAVSVGSYVVLNPDGWIVTASHILEPLRDCNRDQGKIADLEAERAEVLKRTSSLPAKKRQKELAKLRPDPKWLTNVGYWWSCGSSAHNVQGDVQRDIAVAQLQGYAPPLEVAYPTFRHPEDHLPAGTMVVRVGFPFTETPKVGFDVTTGRFAMGAAIPQLVRFPLEGMVTRGIFEVYQAGGPEIQFFETSTPALGGHSGGAVVDVDGRVCGITSRVMRSLGYVAKVQKEGREVEEPYFHHTGVALHYKELLGFIGRYNIQANVAPRRVN